MRANGGGGRSRSTPTASSGGRSGRPGSSARCCSRVSSWRPAPPSGARPSTRDRGRLGVRRRAGSRTRRSTGCGSCRRSARRRWRAWGSSPRAATARGGRRAGSPSPSPRRQRWRRRRTRCPPRPRGRSSARYRRGTRIAAAARQRLERARTLNPLTDRADVVEGTLALRDGDVADAGRAFRPRRARDPGDWYVQMQLAVVELRQSGGARRSPGCARTAPEPERAGDRRRARGGTPGQPLPDVSRPWPCRDPAQRHPVGCRPVLGLGTNCSEGRGVTASTLGARARGPRRSCRCGACRLGSLPLGCALAYRALPRAAAARARHRGRRSGSSRCWLSRWRATTPRWRSGSSCSASSSSIPRRRTRCSSS